MQQRIVYIDSSARGPTEERQDFVATLGVPAHRVAKARVVSVHMRRPPVVLGPDEHLDATFTVASTGNVMSARLVLPSSEAADAYGTDLAGASAMDAAVAALVSQLSDAGVSAAAASSGAKGVVVENVSAVQAGALASRVLGITRLSPSAFFLRPDLYGEAGCFLHVNDWGGMIGAGHASDAAVSGFISGVTTALARVEPASGEKLERAELSGGEAVFDPPLSRVAAMRVRATRADGSAYPLYGDYCAVIELHLSVTSAKR